MSWWRGGEETRILIAPDSGAIRNSGGSLLSLRHPKSGSTTCYLLNDGLLQELHWFKQPYSSWFLGDYVCEDGRLYTATPVDPVFVLLPIFEEARMKKGNDPGKFRQLDEILFVNGHPGYSHLMSIAENCMQLVCDTKEIGSSKFFRLDDSKVLAWLHCKVCRLKEALPSLDKNYAAQNEKNTLADAVTLLGEYLKDEPWLTLLCNHLKLDLLEITRKATDSGNLNSTQTNLVSPGAFQEKGKSESKTKNTGKQQAKKSKVETESRNIKEMFSRVTRSKRN